MKKTFEPTYEIDERVRILPNTEGTVRGYYVDDSGVEYNVSVWDGSKREAFYFRECELEKYHAPKPIQFPNTGGMVIRYDAQPPLFEETGTEIKP